MECLFPIWKKNTRDLASQFLREEFNTNHLLDLTTRIWMKHGAEVFRMKDLH